MSLCPSAARMRRISAICSASSRIVSQLSSSTFSSSISRDGRWGVVGTREASTMKALTGASSGVVQQLAAQRQLDAASEVRKQDGGEPDPGNEPFHT